MIETVEEITREMRDGVVANGWMEQTLREFADRIEAAVRNSTLLCHQVCSCEILAKMETENERLRALVGELADALNNARAIRPDMVIIDDKCDVETMKENAK